MKNKVTVVLVVLLAVAAFAAGSMWTEIRYLKQGKGGAVEGGQGSEAVTPTPAPQVRQQPPEVTELSEEQRAEIEEFDYVYGEEEAPVTMVEFTDYQCPFCGRYSNETLPKIEEEYIKTGKVKYVLRNIPLTFHQYAQKAAEAAMCAAAQGKYWEYHEVLFENQQALEVESLKKYAGQVGLDQAKFDQCLDEGEMEQVVKDDAALAQRVGVTGTPTFFINGKKLVGAQPYEVFKKMIDEALAGEE